MRIRIKPWLALPALLTVVLLASPALLTAQTLTTVYSFSVNPGYTSTNADGSNPVSGLALSSNVLYGTTLDGGTAGSGTVFRVNVDGTGFTNLHSFTNGNDGIRPAASVVVAGGAVFGTAEYGGTNNSGVLFKANTDGTGYTILHTFNASTDGAYSVGGLILSGSYLYGTASGGGTSGAGTVYRMMTNGTAFAVLHNLNFTNDGGIPTGSLILSNGTLYGTASEGGASNRGTVFKVNNDGSAFTVLHTFADLTLYTNNEGVEPTGSLALSGNTLYGTTPYGGTSSFGTLFAVHTDGTSFTNLHNFLGTTDGVSPQGGLVLSSNTLYGTTQSVGNDFTYYGTVFSIGTNGTGFQTVYNFPMQSQTAPYTNSAGSMPVAGLIVSSNTLYGTAKIGGAFGSGTVFKIAAHPGFFNGEIYLGGGVYYLAFGTNFFGLYTYAFFPYLYHYDMGFEYFFDGNDAAHGAYFYDFTSGHFWYSSPTYPFPNMYDFSLNSIIYYFPDTTNSGHYTTNPRYFYNYTTKQIFTQ